jgi:hypothetical protein
MGSSSYKVCGNYDSDPCSEWSDSFSCPSGKVCQSGQCVSSCTNECTYGSTERKCSGNYVQQRNCGNYDSDPCTEWSDWINIENCGSSGWTDEYQCSGNWVQRKWINKGCAYAQCYANSEWKNYQNCSASGQVCQNDQCVSIQVSVDLKANGSDGPITIAYNTSANLTWTSTNATTCYASNGWSGSKSTSGSESTGNLTSSRTYTITCTGTGGSASDSVTVNIEQLTLSVTLQAIPASGFAPLNGVDLRATVLGTATGPINYKFDCTNNGTWDLELNGYTQNPYTATDLCSYPSAGTYTAKVRVERSSATPAENTTQIQVNGCNPPPTVDIKANGSDGPITIPYNTAATLTWTSTNANTCYASGDWSGSKLTSGSESTGNLTTKLSYTYNITCTGPGGSVSDSVRVDDDPPTLSVTLQASPASGCASLNGVDLQASVSGTAVGTINYKFDCTNNGTWDLEINGSSQNPYTATDLCSYATPGTYTAKVRVERSIATPAENTTQIQVNDCTPNPPTVDIKANGSDGPITIAYNTSANLTWTSTNATTCYASNGWSGSKSTSGSESTGNLTSSRTYTITCTGTGGSGSDSVTVNVQTGSFSVILEAIPSSGCASLQGVDLRATLSGSASGVATFYFDCTNDGTWEGTYSGDYEGFTAYDICNYSTTGTYTAKVRAERQGLTAENTTQINSTSCYTTPTVDIEANGSDGPITIAYNTSATLTWTSTNATTCYAYNGWSGSKSTSGSESTGNLTYSRTHTITCTGTGGSASDSVTVNTGSYELYASLYVNPSSGCAPLNGVDFTVTVSGTATGYINHLFDCTNDGTWERTVTTNDSSYTVYDVCNYSSAGTYTVKVRTERQSLTVDNTAQITVNSCYSSTPTVNIKANGSDGPVTIATNAAATLTWTSTNATYCYASGNWSGSKSTSGSESTGNLTSSRTYTITCTGTGGSASDSVTLNVTSVVGNLTVNKLVRNLSNGTGWLDTISAEPNDVVSFLIQVTSGSSTTLYDVTIQDTLPDKIIPRSNLKVDGVSVAGNIASGLNIGTLLPYQTKNVTFDADVAGTSQFAFGETTLVNTALVYSSNVSNSDTARTIVTRKAVAGAATGFSTGLTNNIFLDSFFLPLVMTLITILLFKSHILSWEEWLDERKRKYLEYHSKKLLQFKISRIKAGEFFRKVLG